jgi:hypothetical protein
MRRLSLVLILAVSTWACGSSGPTMPTTLVAPARPTFTLSGVVSAVTPTSLMPLEGVHMFVNGHRATTDDQGFYSIAGLEPNSSGGAVTATKPGYKVETTSLMISGDTRVDMQLVRTAIFTVSGVVSEATSAGPVAVGGVRVDVSSMPCDERSAGCVGFGDPIGILQTTTTDTSGFYRISGLYPGPNNVIWAAKDGFEDAFPAQYPENSEGGRAITIDGDSRFDIHLIRR